MNISFRARLFNSLAPFIPVPLRDSRFIENPTRNDKANAIPRAIQRAKLCESRNLNGYVLHTIHPGKGASGQSNHVVYFHGGAYVGQALSFHWNFFRKLVDAMQVKLTFVQYPLAPESSHVEAVSHALNATELIQSEFDSDRFFLMGDSAGAGLSLALVRNLIEMSKTQPFKKLALISPWVDPTRLDLVDPALAARDPILIPDKLKVAARLYAGADSVSHADVSPLQASFRGFPPVGIWIGTRDIFYGDMPLFLKKLEEDGVESVYHVGEEMLHDYPLFPIPEGAQAIDQLKKFISG